MYLIDFKQKEERVKKYPTSSAKNKSPDFRGFFNRQYCLTGHVFEVVFSRRFFKFGAGRLNQVEVFQGFENAVVVHVGRRVTRDRFDRVGRVAHRDAQSDGFQHIHIVAAVAERDHVVDVVTVFFADFGDANGFAAVFADDVDEQFVPAHRFAIGHMAHQAFLFVRRDIGGQLVKVLRHFRHVNDVFRFHGGFVDVRQQIPHAPIHPIEHLPVRHFKAACDFVFVHIGQNRVDIAPRQRVVVQNRSVRFQTQLAVEADKAVEIEHFFDEFDVVRRASRGDEDFDALTAQRLQRLQCRFGHFMRAKAD